MRIFGRKRIRGYIPKLAMAEMSSFSFGDTCQLFYLAQPDSLAVQLLYTLFYKDTINCSDE